MGCECQLVGRAPSWGGWPCAALQELQFLQGCTVFVRSASDVKPERLLGEMTSWV